MTCHALKKDIPSLDKVISNVEFFIKLILNIYMIDINKITINDSLNQTIFLLYSRAELNNETNFYKWLKENEIKIFKIFHEICIKFKSI